MVGHGNEQRRPRSRARLFIAAFSLPAAVAALWWWAQPQTTTSTLPRPQLVAAPRTPAPAIEPQEPVVAARAQEPPTIHGGKAQRRSCVGCHEDVDGGRLTATSARELCGRCHARSHTDNSHPVGVALSPTMSTSLPLAPERRIDCVTCHDAHGERRLLLRAATVAALCRDCHRDR